jgi:hypothetical protein
MHQHLEKNRDEKYVVVTKQTTNKANDRNAYLLRPSPGIGTKGNFLAWIAHRFSNRSSVPTIGADLNMVACITSSSIKYYTYLCR